MKDNFNACMAEVFRHEGGYANDPHDPGGETNMGISRRSYPKEDIRGMTKARAAQIYRRDFWAKMGCDDLPEGLDLVAFDAAVNSGPGRSAKWLQQAVGVTADGKVGPVTLLAAKSTYAPAAVQRAIGFRLAYLKRLKTWPRYGKGWQRRCDEVEALAGKMAMGRPVAPPVDVDPPIVASPDAHAATRPQSAQAWWVRAIMRIFDAIFAKWRT